MNKRVTISDLKDTKLYENELLEGIRNGEFWRLSYLPNEKLTDRNYMEPLLFAVKNDLNTYEVYKYCGENIQNDMNIVLEILRSEPRILVGTPITQNREFILNNINAYPELIIYMSPALKTDTKFIKELQKARNIEPNKSLDIAQTMLSNIELIHNKEFMKSAIKTDVTFLEFLGSELKNDYKFLKEQSDENENVIDYVVKNVTKFGIEGIKAVRDSSKNFTVEDCMKVIDEMAKNSTDERYAKMRDKINEKGIDDIRTVRWITAMVAQSDNVSPELVKKVLNYSMLTMEKTRQDVNENGKMQINKENMQSLITPLILNRLKYKVEKQDLEVDEELKEKLHGYEEFYKEYQTLYREKIRKELIQKNAMCEITEDIGLSDIKEAIEEMANIVKKETNVSNEGIDEI